MEDHAQAPATTGSATSMGRPRSTGGESKEGDHNVEMLDRLERLLDHLEWSNRRALDAARGAENEEVLRLLGHLLAAETVWLLRLESGDSSELEIWPGLSVGECAERLSRNVEGYRRYIGSLSEADLERKATYRNSKGEEFHTPVGEILLHVFLHGSYHRGQIALRMRDGGDQPVNTDFINFVRVEPPATHPR